MAKGIIYVVSDSLGGTAEQVARAAASQFGDEMTIVRLTLVRDEARLADAVTQAKRSSGTIFFTLADSKLRARLLELASGQGVICVDVLGPALEALEKATGSAPQGGVGAMRQAGRSYFARVDALEFAVAHDDGKGMDTLADAEIVLVGVSRTSKTPLAMYLAYKGWRVANVPIVLGIEPPPQLFEVDAQRVVGLVADQELMLEIRGQRFKALSGSSMDQAQARQVVDELDYSKQIMRQLGARAIDVTHHAIEEIANEILKGFT